MSALHNAYVRALYTRRTYESLGIRAQFALVIFLVFAAHLFIFRDVVNQLPGTLAGTVMVSREELVPIFDFDTQFFDQMQAGESALTSSPEIRVSYAALTAWARSSAYLPITLVLFSSACVSILIYALYYFARHVLQVQPALALHAALFPGIAIGFIVLYSKIAHFYTLQFGFSLFALALVYTLAAYLSPERVPYCMYLWIALLVLLNPAIHFHILYYLASGVLIATITILGVVRYRHPMRFYSSRLLAYAGVVALSFIPYAAFIYYLTASLGGAVSESIPIDYWIIYYASIPLEYLFALNMPGHVDLYLHGNYVSPHIKYTGVLVTLLAILAAVLITRKDSENTRLSIAGLFSVYVLSLWMAAGYVTSFSLHSTMSSIVTTFQGSSSALASAVESVLYLFLQILRYPHRFEFVLFVAVSLLASATLAHVFARYRIFSHRPGARVLVVLSLLILFFSTADYRQVLASGDFNGFVRPLPVPKDLQHIRAILTEAGSQLPGEADGPQKLVVLPSLESGRALSTHSGSYSFLDKTLIYYLNYPSVYYGSGASLENKLSAIILYTAIVEGAPWWQEYLRAGMQVRYVLVPHTQVRDPGVVYVPEIESAIESGLSASAHYIHIYDGDTFDLFEARAHASHGTPTLLSAGDAAHTLASASGTPLFDSELFIPYSARDFMESMREGQGVGTIVSDRIQNVAMDLTTLDTGRIYPNQKTLPFDAQTVNSSFYLSNTFSYFTLLDEESPFSHFQNMPRSPLNIVNPYFYQISDDPIHFPIRLADDVEAHIVVRGVGLERARAWLDAEEIELIPLEGADYRAGDYQYFISSQTVRPGVGLHTLSIEREPNSDNFPILEFASVIPRDMSRRFTISERASQVYEIVLH